MSAVEAIRMAWESGVHIGIEGADLILDAEQEPTSRVLEAIRRHKADIVDLLTAADGDRTAESWRVFYGEHATKAEFDGGRTREEAAARAFECCIVEWLNRHPEHSDPGRCAWCGKQSGSDHVVVPFLADLDVHTWLHPECWHDWHQDQRERARRAIAVMGVNTPPKNGKRAGIPDDFEKSDKTQKGETNVD